MIILRLMRRMLALLIRLLLINRVVTLGVLGLLVIGFVGAPLLTAYLSGGQPSAAAAAPRQAQLARSSAGAGRAPSPAVESYVKGMTDFDAKLMLGALSQDAVNQMQSRLGSVDNYQAVLDEAKRSGARYEEISYIGAYPLRDGSEYFFYVIGRRGFTEPNAYEQVYYVFTVGPEGKIVKIE